MMLLATLLGSAVSTIGLALSYEPDLPAGPTIILLAGGIYLISALGTRAIARRRARMSVLHSKTGG
jgi:zinc transport system permease protein